EDGATVLTNADGVAAQSPEDSWVTALVDQLDAAPAGLHHDVIRVRTAATGPGLQSLRSLLETLSVLPIVPVVIASSVAAALAVVDQAGPALLDRSRTILLTPHRAGDQTIVSVRGAELLDAGPSSDLVLASDADVTALGAGLGLVSVV